MESQWLGQTLKSYFPKFSELYKKERRVKLVCAEGRPYECVSAKCLSRSCRKSSTLVFNLCGLLELEVFNILEAKVKSAKANIKTDFSVDFM